MQYSDELKSLEEFHGHLGPFVVVGLKIGKLAIDKNGNAHIVWHTKEIEYEHLPMSSDQRTLSYYTVYYSKIDKNGNIVINEMVIDKDEKQTDYSNYICFAIIIVGIAIAIAILIIFMKITKPKTPKYYCQKCQKQLIFIPQYQRWYCENCNEYK